MPGVFRLPPRLPRGPVWIPTVAAAGDTFVNIDPGNITWTGQSITASITVAVSPGAITWSGSSITATVGVPITAGAVTWNGQSITASINAAITPGNITWTGQEITAVTTAPKSLVMAAPRNPLVVW